MLAGAGFGALAGLGKSMLFDAPRAERQRQLAATTEALSPWTGMHADPVAEADPFGSAFQGAITGAQFQQDYDKYKQGLAKPDPDEAMFEEQDKLNKEMDKYDYEDDEDLDMLEAYAPQKYNGLATYYGKNPGSAWMGQRRQLIG